MSYELTANGSKIKEGVLNIALAPQESKEITVPTEYPSAVAGVEYLINFSVRTKKAEGLIPQNHEIAHGQFCLPVSASTSEYNAAGPTLKDMSTENAIIVRSSKVNFEFDKDAGLLKSYKVKGLEYFAGGFGIQPNFWRAPNDNDYGNGNPKRLQVWKQASRDFNVSGTDVKMADGKAFVTVTYGLPTGNTYTVLYTIYQDGIMNVNLHFTPTSHKAAHTDISEDTHLATYTPGKKKEDPDRLEVPRIGVRFRVPMKMNRVKYYGRGPGENYIDRNAGSMIGLYDTTVETMYVNYVRPQENGHRTDTRWLMLSDSRDSGFMIKADSTVGFNALRNAVEDFDSEETTNRPYQWRNYSAEEIRNHNEKEARNVLRRMTHVNDIKARDFIEVCIDMKQQGVGGYDSWGAKVQSGFTIPANCDYKWGFTFIPVNGKNASNYLKYKY